jgi:hypothetical protein
MRKHTPLTQRAPINAGFDALDLGCNMDEGSPSGRVFGFDSEFLMSGRANHPEDVQSVQFSFGDPDGAVVLEDAGALKAWLHNHKHVKAVYGFVVLPDLASIGEWIGDEHVSYRERGSQLIGRIKFSGADITVYDARPLLQNFGLRRLEDCGRLVGYPKRAKPAWLGLRGWESEKEHQDFIEYAKADAVISSLIVSWLKEHFGADPAEHASAGTLAGKLFALPRRLSRLKKTVHLSPLEHAVKGICFAGRSEGFVTGFTPNVVYNDIKSLYPVSLVATRALGLIGAERCDPGDLSVDLALDNPNYGWIDGSFETHNDLWGLPLRGTNNFYATGKVQGLYHTFDIAAAKAEILHVTHAYKPIFAAAMPDAHNAYRDMLVKRLDGAMDEDEKRFSKAVLNSLTGKLGQSHPISTTSNFFAYSTVLAHSHLVMSQLFDRCPSKVLAMDTDSIFSATDMSGKRFEISGLPLTVEAKGKGDLAFFRSKNYILQGEGEPVYGRHGWLYFIEDFFKLMDGPIEILTRADIKHTLLTRQFEAKKMAKGRWRTKPVTLDLPKIKALLSADLKRDRLSYDSYQLLLDHKNMDSRAWRYEDIMSMDRGDDPLSAASMSAAQLNARLGALHV